ncbi:MAG: AMP-dependent synthetase/ligase, partial [Microcystaceae cyanobacterium]
MTPLVDYQSIQALPDVWRITAERFPSVVALQDPHSTPTVSLTYGEMYQKLQQFAIALQQLGIKQNEKVALFADNSPRWFIADQGSILAGAVNAVRSSQADREELLYILRDSESRGLIVEDRKTLNKLKTGLGEINLNFIVFLTDEEPDPDFPVKQLNYSQLLDFGLNHQLEPVNQTFGSLATLIYTSGTTGQPKGAMLSHGNLLHQVQELKAILHPQQGDRVLSILPSWHSYERSAEYFLLSQGCTLIYTSIRTFKNDLKKFKPIHMVGVPRLWESLYEGIQKQFRDQPQKQRELIQSFFKLSGRYILMKRIANNLSLAHLHASTFFRLNARLQSYLLAPFHQLGDRLVYAKIREGTGGNLKTLVSGGGSLAKHLDDFYEIVNIPVLVGYGLTETAPVTNARTPERNLRYSSGQP